MATVLDSAFLRQPHGYLNLNTAAYTWMKKQYFKDLEVPSLADPDVAHQMEEETHTELGLAWSYGGWLEDRSIIRHCTYLDKGKLYLHTGIDVNVNPGTPVFFSAPGTVVYVGDDKSSFGKGGWGVHMIQRVDLGPWTGKVILYAHLAPITLKVGTRYFPGDLIGCVGDKETNGFWRPHLHVQCVDMPQDSLFWTHDQWSQFSEEVDGYVPLGSESSSARRYPDPTALLFGAYYR